MKPARIQIFSPFWERTVLLFGFLPLIFVAWDPGWMHSKWKLSFISDILFLNIVHNAFSFYIMWRSDEVRTAIRTHYGNSYSLHLRAMTVFCVGFVAYYYFFMRLLPTPEFRLIALVAIQFLALQHALSQAHGLSRLYDHSLKQNRSLTEAEAQRLRAAGTWERRFHRIALFGIAVRALWTGNIAYGNQSPTDWNYIATIGRYILILGTTGLVATCFYRPYWRESNQWLFNLRRVWELLPSYFNPTYIALQRLNHGFEYLAVTATMEKNAKKVRSLKIAAAVFAGVVGARIFFYMYQMIYRDSSTPFEPLAFTGDFQSVTLILALSSLSISLMHYYYDSQIFRFSKSEFRENVLPLLTAHQASATNRAESSEISPSRSSTM